MHIASVRNLAETEIWCCIVIFLMAEIKKQLKRCIKANILVHSLLSCKWIFLRSTLGHNICFSFYQGIGVILLTTLSLTGRIYQETSKRKKKSGLAIHIHTYTRIHIYTCTHQICQQSEQNLDGLAIDCSQEPNSAPYLPVTVKVKDYLFIYQKKRTTCSW